MNTDVLSDNFKYNVVLPEINEVLCLQTVIMSLADGEKEGDPEKSLVTLFRDTFF
jgi:hypothetical protein